MPKSSRRTASRSGRTETYRPGMKDRSDWNRVRQTTDEEIDRQIAEDPDTAPAVDESWMEHPEIVLPDRKEPVSIRLDTDVLDFFRRTGKGYQTRINAVLRSYVRAQKTRGAETRKAQLQVPASKPRGRRKV